MSKVTITVDQSFLDQAFEAACSEWKRKLEKELPEVFKKDLVKKFFDEFGVPEYYPGDVFISNEYIFFPLPNANNEWTVSTWEYIIKIIERANSQYNMYIDHRPSTYERARNKNGSKIDASRYISINLGSWERK